MSLDRSKLILLDFFVEKCGYAPHPQVFQTCASTKLASSPLPLLHYFITTLGKVVTSYVAKEVWHIGAAVL